MAHRVYERAPAKINLNLHVLGRRKDGYHLIESLVAFADIGDRLTLCAADTFSLKITGPFAQMLEDEHDNLVLRAARVLADRVPSLTAGADIVLEKNLPIAAGLGGGSADAAALLRALPGLYAKRVSRQLLSRIAAGLGADVPACLLSKSLFMSGTGVEIEPVAPLPRLCVVLVNPGVMSASGDIYRALDIGRGTHENADRASPPPGPFSSADGLLGYLDATRNDLEGAAIRHCPEIGDVLDVLSANSRCRLARMSGSGATCFGLFDSLGDGRRAGEQIAGEYPRWWVRSGMIGGREQSDKTSETATR